MLEKQGCTVHTVTQTLSSMPHDRIATLAESALTYDVSHLSASERDAQSSYKKEVLASMSHSDLVRTIINRPIVVLRKSGINTGFTAENEYATDSVQVEWVPLDNLIGGYGAAHCMTQVLSRGE